jgi:Peptidase family M1 domain
MKKTLILALLLLPAAPTLFAQSSAGTSMWNSLSSPSMDPSKTAITENVDIVRDRVHITLMNGTIQFVKPVNGIVFGAVFHGEGRVQADPPNPAETHQLQLFTKQDKLSMAFTDATFSFTDGLFDEVAKQVKWKDGGASDELYAKRQQEREDLGAEYLPKLFKSLMSPDQKRTSYFLADLKTKEKGWIDVRDDATEFEEIRVGRWSEAFGGKLQDYWMLFPAGGRDPRHVYDDPSARQDFLVLDNQIDTTVTEGAELSATARLTLQPRYAGERVLLFDLDSNLRISSVKDAQGKPLEFIQARERKDRNQSYGEYVAVVLNSPTSISDKQIVEFQYAGKRVVVRVGDGNYACESFGWYPSPFQSELGVDEFALRTNFDLTFRSPKKFKLVATGDKLSETVDGKEIVSEWKNDKPLTVAGFAFGDYKLVSDKVGDIEVDVYANNQPDDFIKSIQAYFNNDRGQLGAGPNGSPTSTGPAAAVGNLTPSGLGKTINVETANTLKVFQNYFGPYPYKTLSVTSISGNYGQGWPGLLFLGWFTFLDSTQRHELGINNQTQVSDFFRAHESSHQWWGHRVGWKSFHDQWLSEGFAEFSGLLYVQYRQNLKESITQFRLDKDLMAQEDMNRHRTEELGPITMGQRIRSSLTNGRSYQDLIYSKGAYVLQMIREQLTDPKNPDPDHLFKETMQDYCKTFDNQSASTEDFKAIVEKHMTKSMDLDGNRKMDWFFNQYVYGSGMPQYTFHATVTPTADGKTTVSGQLTRTGVPDNWKDVLPLYAHMGDKIVRLGSIGATHPTEPINFVIAGKIDKLTINEREDIFGTIKQ